MSEQLPGPYDPDTPQQQQAYDWTCSIRSTAWTLWSIGGVQGVDEIGTEMVALGLVTPEWGLMDASGSGMAGYLADKSGWPARSYYPVDWDALPDLGVGEIPCAMGGAGWYHWVGVRGFEGGALHLANSADGYMGVGQILTEADFNRLGPFALVIIQYQEEAELSDAEQAELAQYRAQQPYYDTALGTTDSPGGIVGAALGTMEATANSTLMYPNVNPDAAALANVILGQCAALREQLGI